MSLIQGTFLLNNPSTDDYTVKIRVEQVFADSKAMVYLDLYTDTVTGEVELVTSVELDIKDIIDLGEWVRYFNCE